jgi:hypothetical protein
MDQSPMKSFKDSGMFRMRELRHLGVLQDPSNFIISKAIDFP